ncbi:MAG: trigger factor [Bacillota bacterium]|uniref:Trigger factor n=1 Tax=Thermanaerosceptrum fracticalcis TaxID=1712410 RepID=A0A7G6E654_THEFR|nr:trigger factor [Thermanaerosceptrum fracticalcis]QNB47558.1 trigger factor [Thermanaerosceptrum fracticalcis]
MNVTAERLDKTKAQVTVEVPVEKFEESLQHAYRIVSKKVNVPGFRKGKAPRRIIENMYGTEILYEEALQHAVPRAYFQALDQIKDEYTAVSDPEYEIVQLEKGKPFIFKAKFDLKPEVKLGEYKGLELEKPSAEIGPADVDNELERMQQRYAKLVVVEGPAEKGDVLTIDFVGKVDGQPFEGGKGENYPLELGSNTFIPGFEDQLIGVKAGETVDVNVTFPEEYHVTELAGKDAVFTVTVKENKRKELSPLDDEFAKDVSEFSTLQELRADIENKLKEAAQKKAESELRVAAVKKATENAEIEIPQSMIENRVNTMVENFAYRLQQQGISFDYYMQATNTNIDDIKNNYRTEAEASLRSDLVLEAIAKAESITVSEEELDEEIKKMAERYKQEPAKFREVMEKQGQISSLKFGIMLDKAVDFIIEQAKIS